MEAKVSRRPYVRPLPRVWWFVRRPRYLRYMAREFTCLFIGAYTVLMIYALAQLAQGPVAWQAFLGALRTPASVVFHVLALGFAVYHSVTWFNLTPKALPIPYVCAAHYAGWVLVSALVLALAF